MGNWKLSLKNNQLHIRIKNKRSLRKDFQKNRGRREIYFHTRPKPISLSALSNTNNSIRAPRRWTPPLAGRATSLMGDTPHIDGRDDNPRPGIDNQLLHLDPRTMNHSTDIAETMTDNGYFYYLTHFYFLLFLIPAEAGSFYLLSLTTVSTLAP